MKISRGAVGAKLKIKREQARRSRMGEQFPLLAGKTYRWNGEYKAEEITRVLAEKQE